MYWKDTKFKERNLRFIMEDSINRNLKWYRIIKTINKNSIVDQKRKYSFSLADDRITWEESEKIIR